MGTSKKYPEKVFERNEDAIEWIKSTSKKNLEIFVGSFLRQGQTFPFPRLSVHNRYPGSVFTELCSTLDIETKRRIHFLLSDLLKKFDLEKNSNEYLFNLLIATTTLGADPDIGTNTKKANDSFKVLYKMAKERKFYRKEKSRRKEILAYGEDLHLFLLKAFFSFPVRKEKKGQILEICEMYIDDADYAPICYRQIFDVYLERGITDLPRYLESTKDRKYHEYMFPIEIYFSRPETAQIIRNSDLKNLLKSIVPPDKQKDFEKAGLIRMNLIPPTSIPGSKEEISIRIMASGEEITLDERDLGREIAEEILEISQTWEFTLPENQINGFKKFVDQGMLGNGLGKPPFPGGQSMSPHSSGRCPPLVGRR